jgi:hypothetical protein
MDGHWTNIGQIPRDALFSVGTSQKEIRSKSRFKKNLQKNTIWVKRRYVVGRQTLQIMAIVFNNDLTLGLRGRVGKTFVFRAVGGRTIVSCAPRKPDPRKQSVSQRRTRANFKEAAAWAVRTLMDAEKKLYYQRRAKLLELPNAYIAAVRDYMRRESMDLIL